MRFTFGCTAIIFLFMMLAIPQVYAFGETISIDERLKTDLIISDSAKEYPAISIKGFWDAMPLIEDTKADLVLIKHDSYCGINCMSEFQIVTYEESALVDDIKFYRLDEGKTEERSIRGYQLQIYGDVKDYTTECSPAKLSEEELINETKPYDVCIQVESGSHKDWINYNIGEELIAGTYDVKLLGQKAPYMSIDWVIKTQGKLIEQWATWGNISTGSQAEVKLNSPTNNSIVYTNPVTINYSMNITGGAVMANTTGYIWYANGSLAVSNVSLFMNTNVSSNGHSFGTVDTQTQYSGYSFNVTRGRNITITNVTKSGTCTATKAYLKWINNTAIATATFSGNVATFNNILLNGSKYRIEVGSDGGSYTRDRNDAVSFPVTNNDITWYAGSLNGADFGTSYGFNINNIGYQTFQSSNNLTQTFTNFLPIGSYKYNGKGCDSDGACGFAPQNFTFSIDNVAPTINLNYPTALINYGAVNGTLQLNFTTSDTNLDKVWYNYNGTNVSVTPVNGTPTLANITLSTKKNVTIYANDTAGNLNATTFSWDYYVFENSRSANATSYETAYETYSVNVTANSSLTAVYLNFNGTEFQTVNTAANIWSYSRDLPSGVGNSSISYRFIYGGTNISSINSYQNVLSTIFQICNATYGTQFINFTFKDENALTNINATMQTATWTYYLGTGSEKKSYTYTTSGNSSNYTFCATPNRTLYAEPSITYLYTNYPARFYTPGVLTLTNTTTSTVLYLLSATDGIYVTFVTISDANVALSGALVSITRTILGSLVTLAQGTTDSAGSYTVWLNPNYEHTIIASKTGYGSNTQTIKPTQSSYTLILSSGANYSYVSNVNGLLWSFFPRERLTTNATNFGFNVSSQYNSLIKCKIELLNNNKSTILSSAETITSNGSFCSVKTTYVPSSAEPKIKGRLLIDIGDGYQILEEDAYWFLLDYNTTGMTITDWFNGLTDADLRYFNNDTQHREYTYILIFFLIVMIICACLNQAGWDIQTGGGMIFLVGGLVWVASVPGFLNLAGISPYDVIDKYFVAVIYSMFCIGFGARSMS